MSRQAAADGELQATSFLAFEFYLETEPQRWALMHENGSGWKGMPFNSSNWAHTGHLHNVTETHSSTCHFNVTFISLR